MKHLFFILGLIVSAGVIAGPVPGPRVDFVFDSPEQEAVFNKLSDELRCLVCQNQNIADSNAPLAMDLRVEIYGMLKNGKTEQDIIDFMVVRYGEYVLYRPQVKPITWLLWFGPVIIFFVGVWVAMRFIKQQNNNHLTEELTAEERRRLQELEAENPSITKTKHEGDHS